MMVVMMTDDKYMGDLSPELQQKAKENLGETAEIREKSIHDIRQWLHHTRYLNADSSDRGILRFLRTCKYNLDDTKKRMEMYYSVKTAAPEFYSRWDPRLPEVAHVINSGIFLPLADTDEEGHVVIILRAGAVNPDVHKLEDIVRAAMMIYAVVLKETDNLQICGQVMIMDLSKLSMSVVSMCHPTVLKKSIKCWQDCSPSRVKGVHYFKANTLFHTVFKIIKPLLKEKMRKRHHLHGSKVTSMHKLIPQSILPQEYGGSEGSVQEIIDKWKKKMEDNREWLLQQERFKADPKLRPGKKGSKDMSAELFGIDSSFRDMDID